MLLSLVPILMQTILAPILFLMFSGIYIFFMLRKEYVVVLKNFLL